MSIEDVLARVAQLETVPTAAAAPAAAPAQTDFAATLAQSSELASLQSAIDPSLLDPSSTQDPLAAGQATATPDSLLSALQQLLPATSTAAPAAAPSPSGSAGPRVLAAAETQVGQSEQPPGSNDGPAIQAYRSAVPGSQAGDPWCAEFVSWAAAQAGAPIGDGGTGFRSVAALTSWASQTGRLLPAGSTPQPGDLILFGDRHVGIVESVEANGTIDTVEGNYGNAVQHVKRSPSEATGFVRL